MKVGRRGVWRNGMNLFRGMVPVASMANRTAMLSRIIFTLHHAAAHSYNRDQVVLMATVKKVWPCIWPASGTSKTTASKKVARANNLAAFGNPGA